MAKILIVDDEPNVRYALCRRLQDGDREILTAGTAGEGIEHVKQTTPDVVILDVRLPDMSGLEAYMHMRDVDARLPTIFITAYSSAETAIEAMRRGAFDYLTKPLDMGRLRDVVKRALEVSHLSRMPAIFGDETAAEPADRIIGSSAAMQEVYKSIGRVTAQDVGVLLLGVSGTGKELVARALYQHSQRKDGPFLPINCAALPESLLESELFGYERGAFTGADQQRIGRFEQANGGTLFLDEIGDISLATQAKLLRVLQEGVIHRVGGNEPVAVHVRIIAATNQNLEIKVEDGQFRLDLMYRLNGYTIRLPALRDRREDIPALIEYALKRSITRLGLTPRSITGEAAAILERYDWPGNVRELMNSVQFACVEATTGVITSECLPERIRFPASQSPEHGAVTAALQSEVRSLLEEFPGEVYERLQHRVDRVLLREALEFANGNQVHASEYLGISRNTLRNVQVDGSSDVSW